MFIFLDIDGVMVPAKSWARPELLSDGFATFSPRATAVLQQLISDGARIMLTTSHKSSYTTAEWREIFSRRGINVQEVYSLNNHPHFLSRKDELLDWFNTHDMEESFVIIDDDASLNELPGFLAAHLVLTSPMIGLTQEHVPAINGILHSALHIL